VATVVGFGGRAAGGFGGELAGFGPNLTVRPQVGGPPGLDPGDPGRVREVPGVESATPVWSAGGAAAGGEVSGRISERILERIEVRADRRRLDRVAAAIEAQVAGAEARPLLRVSASEAELARRLTWMLAAIAAVSCLLAAISVGAATAALVEVRRVEYALFLALGFTGRRTAGIFAAELLTVALVAGVVGALAGELAAGALAGRLLAATAGGGWAELAAAGLTAALAAAAVVGGSMGFALRRVGRLEPARVLRGE
jgi:putative ABC transport system permease protein